MLFRSLVTKSTLAGLALGLAVAACGTSEDEGQLDSASHELKVTDLGHPAAVPNEYIVTFRTDLGGLSTASAIDTYRSLGVEVLESYGIIPGFSGRLTTSQLEALKKDPRVAAIETNKIVSVDAVQMNPTYGLDRIDQRHGTNQQYDDFGYAGTATHVYVIDTGVRTTHNEFTGRVGAGYSAIDGSPSPNDCNGHGTHVASTAAGTLYGVAKNATIHAVRVLNCNGSGTYADVIEGMDWVRTNHGGQPSVVNMSLGGPSSAAVNEAVKALTDAGVSVVVAAGNSYGANACNSSPAGAASALTIGATSPGEQRAAFSNVGPCVDLFAPGVDVLAAGIASDNATRILSGTSMASPHVAGAVALYLQRFPRATPAQVHDAVNANATPGIVGDAQSANRFLYTNFGEPQGSSCYGRCGGQSADFTCACDEVCKYFGDCCSDYEAVCRAP